MEVFQLILLPLLCFLTVQGKDNGSNGLASNVNNCTQTQAVFEYFETPTCLLCTINAFIGVCPSGTQKITRGMGIRKCILSSRLYGCVHLCKRKIFKRVCCKNYWGPNCRPCPGLESGNATCFGNGQCNDRDRGNGTCHCNSGFEGFACEICSNKTKFGSKCQKDCSCKNGICNSGVRGDGSCLPYTCKVGYYGKNCQTFEKSCNKNCSAYSHCAVDNSTPACKCNPGYSGDGSVCEEIDPCKDVSNVKVQCQKNTVCKKTGPGRHKCVCSQGYTGDGVICSAIDHCQRNHGNCPNNTRCNYLGPGQFNCSCLAGYSNYNKTTGCTITDLCVPGQDCLFANSECVMTAPNLKECKCRKGYVGNGTVCYGNVLQRIDDLHSFGPHKNKLRHVKNIIKRHPDLTLAFTERGPFTVFVPTDNGLKRKFTPKELSDIIRNKKLVHDLIMVHSARAYLNLSSFEKNGELTTLKGWNAVVNSTVPCYHLIGRSEKPSILTHDILASNGIIHVIDEPAWKPDFAKFANVSLAQQDNRTLWEIIVQRSELQNFRDYIQIAGMQHEFEKASANGSTVIAPVNESFSVLDQMDKEFLNSSMEGKAKLRAIIRHHIFGLKIGIIDLGYQSSLTSEAPEFVNVSVLDRGAVLLAGKSKLIDNNVLASNGFIHITNALLIPSFVLPIVPRHCDKNSTIVYSKCRPCALKFVNGNCPTGFVSTGKNDVKCSYTIDLFIVRRIVQGCKTECKPQKRKCCSGFYGPDCSPCPGPVGLPCFGNGKCFGNGRCKCKNNFKGTACELCKNKKKFGLDCTKTCTCGHGTCEGGLYGSGSCRPGTCKSGYSGKECKLRPTGCSGGRVPILRHCSVHALCFVRGGKATCECNTGYEKIGNDCYEIDPCLQKNRGGCDKNAFCTKTGPGKNKCTCSAGWTGDGYYCTPINYCAMQSRGHCHRNATCTFLGPAQARCDCLIGYEGDGTSCKEINTCLKNNGGCSPLAKCIKTGPGQNRCTCRLGYIGNGFICVGSLAVAVKRQRELTTMSALIVKYNLDHFLADPRKNITVFLPSNAAISNLNAESRKILDIPANLFVFGGANIAIGAYFSSQLRNITRLQALFKDVNIIINHTKSGEPLIGGSAKIVTANITASNGVLHIVDRVLLPSFVKKPRTEPSVYEGLCGDKNRFQQMCGFIKKFQLEDEIKNCTHCTIFVPTDEAFHELSHDRYYNKISRVDILYHMTNHFIDARTVLNGQQFTTLAGNIYKLHLEIDKKSGQVIVNGITAAYNTSNSTWMIYTTGLVLKSVQNYCYRNLTIVFRTQCRPCQFGTRRCRPGLFFVGRQDCYYRAFGSVFLGCRALCSRPYKIRRCCPGFWGKDCTACPGENNNPCFGNGKCHDSTTGNGNCECKENFTGVACERCKAGYFGKYCKPCNCVGKATCDREYGFCLCPDNKKGLRCDQKAENTECGSSNVTCHKHASCTDGTCQCDYGFTGNGTICKHTKFCEINNGGCSPDAKCDIIANTAEPNCSCKTNFHGDGYYCRGRNACSKEPCLEQAKCFYARPGRANCICNPGYTGDGENSCELINPCDQDNGGCSFNAKCTFNSTTLNTTCSCSDGYRGDGHTCVGNILETLQNDANLAEFYSRLKKSTIKDVLSPENHVSVIAPANDAFKSSSRRQRRSVKTLSDSDLKYYIISCVALSENDVNTADLSFVTVAGSWLNITSPKVINNQVKVLSVKSVTNSAILVVDRLLDVPQQAQLKNRTMTEVAKDRGYGTFVQLLTAAGLDITSNIYSQPYTMFWPSNDAISRLPEDIKKRLLDANYKSELIDILNYHIIQKTKITTIDVLSYSGGLFRRSREGSPLYISCKGHKGDLFINDRSKIIERDIEYLEGIAYGISEVLLPPGVAGRCDEIKYEAVKGYCTACADNGFCPPGTILESVDKNASCKFQGQYFGCLSRCVKRTKVIKCCKNFYGADCQACPGDVGNPCHGRGSCDDGISGAGNCSCNEPFIGGSCESCSNPEPKCRIIHTNLCTSRMNPCSIFATCVTGRNPLCKCFPNYKGKGYYCQAIDKCQKNNGGCSKHALCRYLGPNQARCECRSGYIGDGYTCTALSPQHPCATNNGNCDVHAGCFDESGDASCRCRDGFIGNGKVCAGSTKDVINDIEDLSEFAKAIRKLSLGVEGNDIIRRLSSEKDHTVFAPINYGFTLKSMTINDLKNHIVEGKLSFKTGQTVYSLARNKITIVVSKNNGVRLNNIASVVSDYPATNGIVVVIDHIIPYKKPPPTPQPTTTETPTATSKTSKFNTTVHAGSDNSSSEKNKLGLIIGVVIGGLVVVVLIILAIYFYKKRHHPKIKYNKNFESIMFESEAYADDQADDDNEYEHQALQHPSSEIEGTTLSNPTYMATDEDITEELLEMTESSSIVPLTERNVISSAEKEEKC